MASPAPMVAQKFRAYNFRVLNRCMSSGWMYCSQSKCPLERVNAPYSYAMCCIAQTEYTRTHISNTIVDSREALIKSSHEFQPQHMFDEYFGISLNNAVSRVVCNHFDCKVIKLLPYLWIDTKSIHATCHIVPCCTARAHRRVADCSA